MNQFGTEASVIQFTGETNYPLQLVLDASHPEGSNKLDSPGDEFGSGEPVGFCQICQDASTGKHYGALSCDGCKGFFRRSVRGQSIYFCRAQGKCVIDKKQRNQCRRCRLDKCKKVGMKPEAVQAERDRISVRPSHSLPSILSLSVLAKAEKEAREPGICIPTPERSVADVHDIHDSMKAQLHSLVNWAKNLPEFMKLPKGDCIALLRSHAGDQLLLGVARRSLMSMTHGHCKDVLVLGNDYIIPREHSQPMIAQIASRIIDELVHPLREMAIDDNEALCLKGIIFFDPTAKGLEQRAQVKRYRQAVHTTLQSYIWEHALNKELNPRFGELLLLLPNVQSISMDLIRCLHKINASGMEKLDKLIHETLLNT